MQITFTEQGYFETPLAKYTTITGICGGKEVVVLQAKGKRNFVNIRYKNAMSKAFRGMGKQFDNFDKALANYKCAKIRAIIEGARAILSGETEVIAQA